jgi:hypothetical protein
MNCTPSGKLGSFSTVAPDRKRSMSQSPSPLIARDWTRPLAEVLSNGWQEPQQHLHALTGEELRGAIAQALEHPLDYPGLAELAYDGDCVVIALQAATKDSQTLLRAIVEQLNRGREEPISLTLLTDPFTASQLDLTELPEMSLAIHDPDAENQFSCLAVGVNDQPLYVHRLLFDADVVIPVGCLGPQQDLGLDDCIFPVFSRRDNWNSFREQSENDRREDVRHVNDQLGTFFAIQQVLGPGDSVQAVLAGERQTVLETARKQLKREWAVNVSSTADLVVATIESQTTEQSWDDFAQALINVVPCCDVAAPIVICSQLKRTPPRETRAAMVDPLPAAEKKTVNKLVQLRQILSDHPVFLSSNLTQAEVEEIGLGYLAATDELHRLAEKSTRGLFLRDAHKCQISLK